MESTKKLKDLHPKNGFSVLREIGMELIGLSLEQVFRKAAGLVAQLLYPDGVRIYLWNKTRSKLELKAYGGLPDEFVRQVEEIIVGEGYSGIAIKSGKPFGINVSEFPKKSRRNLFEKYGIKSVLAIPLIFRDRTLGVLNIASTRNHNYFSDKLDFLFTLGSHISIAVENERLMEELRRTNELLHHLSIHDELTGLYNRRYFTEELRRELRKSIRYRYPLSLMMLDLDFFKDINDKYGHQVGDLVLRQFSACVAKRLRKIDILGRYGGEEFTIILPHTTLSAAMKLGQDLLRAVRQCTFGHPKRPFHMTTSIGITTLDENIENEDQFMKLADNSLYLAKREGRNCIRMVQNIRP